MLVIRKREMASCSLSVHVGVLSLFKMLAYDEARCSGLPMRRQVTGGDPAELRNHAGITQTTRR